MSMLSALHNFATLLFSSKEWVGDYDQAPAYYVAAGNPAKGVDLASGKERLNDETELIVAGNSMVPQGIYDGDKVTFHPVVNDSINRGDFLVIQVDKPFYNQRGTQSKFDTKLRCAITTVPSTLDFDALYDRLQLLEDSVLLPENKKELKEKFQEAKDFYPAQTELMLSITYKDGKLHYSFHPVELIRGKITAVERRQPNGTWETVKPKPLL